MKGMSIAHGAYSAVLWRSVAGVILMLPIFIVRRRPWPGRQALILHVSRGAVAGVSVLLFFWGLVRVPMAQGVALTFLAPLIALFLAAATLGETIRRSAIGGSIIASLGVLAIAAGQVAGAGLDGHACWDRSRSSSPSILYAGSLILLRHQAQLADPLEVALFTSIVLGALLLVAAPWFCAMPAVAQWPGIFGAAVLGRSPRCCSPGPIAAPRRRCWRRSNIPRSSGRRCWAGSCSASTSTRWTVAGAVLIVAGCLFASAARPRPLPQTEAAA